jgi:hypothetical protein
LQRISDHITHITHIPSVTLSPTDARIFFPDLRLPVFSRSYLLLLLHYLSNDHIGDPVTSVQHLLFVASSNPGRKAVQQRKICHSIYALYCRATATATMYAKVAGRTCQPLSTVRELSCFLYHSPFPHVSQALHESPPAYSVRRISHARDLKHLLLPKRPQRGAKARKCLRDIN